MWHVLPTACDGGVARACTTLINVDMQDMCPAPGHCVATHTRCGGTGSVILSHSVRPIFAGGSLHGMLANALRFQATASVNKDTAAL